MKKAEKVVRVGLDLDGVIARHSLGGFWVKVRKIKEKFLKRLRSPSYYYPKTIVEMNAWKIINWLRIPDKDGIKLIEQMRNNGYKFYLITGRFKFNYPLTIKWLKKYELFGFFEEVLVNTQDKDPIKFKLEMINKKKINCFVDDDLEVLSSFNKENLKLFWVVPGHRNGDENNHKHIISCSSLSDSLMKME